MKKLFILSTSILFLSLVSCSSKDKYIGVEEREFGEWQNQIDEICDGLEDAETYEDLQEIQMQAEHLKRRMNNNFIDPDDADGDLFIRR